jgi:acetyltransferase
MSASVVPRGGPPHRQPSIDGLRVGVRQARADDLGLLASLLTQLSPAACQQRYLVFRRFSPETARAEAARILGGPGRPRIAVVATAAYPGHEEAIGVAELARLDEDRAVGEVGIVVRDDLQGAGIGTQLMRALLAAAPSLGVSALRMDVLASNRAMRRLAAQLGAPRGSWAGDGTLQLLVSLDQHQRAPSSQRHSYPLAG